MDLSVCTGLVWEIRTMFRFTSCLAVSTLLASTAQAVDIDYVFVGDAGEVHVGTGVDVDVGGKA